MRRLALVLIPLLFVTTLASASREEREWKEFLDNSVWQYIYSDSWDGYNYDFYQD